MHFSAGPAEMGKGEKYLLITLSFPHCPQLCPQGLSTIHSGCGYSQLGRETICDSLRQKRHFFADRKFYQSVNFVQNLGLDSCSCPEKPLRRKCPENRICDRANWRQKRRIGKKAGEKSKFYGTFLDFWRRKVLHPFPTGKPEAPAKNPNRKKFQKGVDFETKESYNV